MAPIFILTTLSFALQAAAAPKLSPDTLAVKFHTHYPYGIEMHTKTKYAAHKYAHSLPATLANFVDFEFKVYQEILQLFDKYVVSKKYNETDNFLIRLIHKFLERLNCKRCEEKSLCSSVKEYLEEFQENSPKSNGSDATNALAHNILTPFLTIRRFRSYIQQWILARRPSKPSAFQDSVLKYLESTYEISQGPYRTDFHYSMVVIIFAHFILELRAEDIANGIFRGKDVGVKLKASHCLDIGIHAVAMSMYPIGIQWLDLAVDMLNHGDDTAELDFATDWLNVAISKHDKNWKPKDDLGMNRLATFYSKRLNETGPSEERRWHKQVACVDKSSLHNFLESVQKMPWHLQFSVCKGDIQQTELEKSRLFCWYEREIHPRWKIGPIKIELLSSFPRGEIVRFLDVVGDNLGRNLKNEFKLEYPVLNAPVPVGYLFVGSVFKKGELAKKLQVLCESLTGLKAPHHKGLEAATYVPGGFYNTHEDWAGLDNPERRLHNLAFALIYLEGPEHYGQTAFPRLHLAMKPIKGSVVFNYQLLNSGKVDGMMPHAGCPLILGEKLIAARNFWYWDQDHLTCYKEADRRREILVNGNSKYRRPRDTVERDYRYVF